MLGGLDWNCRFFQIMREKIVGKEKNDGLGPRTSEQPPTKDFGPREKRVFCVCDRKPFVATTLLMMMLSVF